MSTTAHRISTTMSSLHADRRRAETLLFELAIRLRGLPVEERTRNLHIRALRLKASLAHWPEDEPDELARRAFCDEVLALQKEIELSQMAFSSVR